MKSIVVFAAHPDDEVLGVGGTVKRLSDEGVDVHAVIMAEGLTSRCNKRRDTERTALLDLQRNACNAAKEVGYTSIDFCGLPDNRMDGMDLLDIIKLVSQYVEKYCPDTVFTPHHGELNIDHRLTCEAVLTACRPVGRYKVERIYGFETPSSSEWNYSYGEPFTPNVYFDITDAFEAKIKGMACYQTEIAKYPHPRSFKALKALGMYRGSNVGFEMAEGFMLMRECIGRLNQGGLDL